MQAYAEPHSLCVSVRFARAGSVIMLLHDPSDIFLEGAKMCNYAGVEALAVAMFALLLVTWFGLRLVILPWWIISSIWWVNGMHLPWCRPVLAAFASQQIMKHYMVV